MSGSLSEKPICMLNSLNEVNAVDSQVFFFSRLLTHLVLQTNSPGLFVYMPRCVIAFQLAAVHDLQLPANVLEVSCSHRIFSNLQLASEIFRAFYDFIEPGGLP